MGAAGEEVVDNDTSNQDPITIHQLEMPEDLKEKALEEVRYAMKEYTIEKDIATYMKRKFDELHGGTTWHCVVGKGFGCSVAYDTQFLIFFQVKQMYILLFKSVE